MRNQLLDKGVERNPNPTINPDYKRGFLDSVKNSQPRLALNYLIDILNEMGQEIATLKEKVSVLGGDADVKSNDDAEGVVEDAVEEAPKPKATSRRAAKPAPEKEDANGEEV